MSSTAPTSLVRKFPPVQDEATRECIDQTVQLSMVVSAPCAIGLAVLAQPIVFLLYGNSTGLAANLLILGSFFDPAQWNVKYFQWSSAGNRTKFSDYGSNRTGCGYCGSGSVAVYKPWSLRTADHNGDLFCGCMCVK